METIITDAEREKILTAAFESFEPLCLKHFPAKFKKKVVIIDKIAEIFEPGRSYSEKEVNELIAGVYHDYVTLRRYLVDFGHLTRTSSGSCYTKAGRKDS